MDIVIIAVLSWVEVILAISITLLFFGSEIIKWRRDNETMGHKNIFENRNDDGNRRNKCNS